MDIEIKEKLSELKSFGKEESELSLWTLMVPFLSDEEKQTLNESLQKEILLLRSK